MSLDLFQLLPAVYRIRDAQLAASMTLLSDVELAQLTTLQTQTTPLSSDQQAALQQLMAKATRGPLQSLLTVIQGQLEIFAADLDQLYDDQFIETCAPWVIPYIGDLIGYRAIHGVPAAVDNPRAEVGETISLRRRKGTVLVLEQLARDVTGWNARALEFFQGLGDTQHVKHVRPWNTYAPDVRGWRAQAFENTPFSRMTRKVDAHNPAAPGLPRHNIRNIGIFLWSLAAYPLTGVMATSASGGGSGGTTCWRLSTLGADMPLFHRAISQGEEITMHAGPENTADRLTRRLLCDDLKKGLGAEYYGEGASLALYLDGTIVDPWKIQVADLSSDSSGDWRNLPTADSAYALVIDPELGRIALPPPTGGGATPKLKASFYYGFNAPMGGGEYERGDAGEAPDGAVVLPYPDTASPARYTTPQDALTYISTHLSGQSAIALEFQTSDIFSLTGPIGFDLPAGTTVELRGKDEKRPTLLLDGEIGVTGDKDTAFLLNGLLLAAGPGMTPGGSGPATLLHANATRPGGKASQLEALTLNDCTLVPGWSLGPTGAPTQPDAPVLIAEAPGLTMTVQRSILGAVRAPPLVSVSLTDSILDGCSQTGVAYAAPDGATGGGALTLVGCTAVGKVRAQLLELVSDSIVWAVASGGWATGLIADRLQTGCVRFSFLPAKAVTPRRFECVERALGSVQPIFAAQRYGAPGYLKLVACTDDRIRRGADDGGEMGAFHFLLAPLRETDLVARLQEYTPVGLDVGLIYQS